MLRGASVKSRLRRMDCAARCDPVKASRSSRRTKISPGARRERTIPPAWSRRKSLSEQDAVGKAGLRRAEFERAGWQREKEQVQKIRCVRVLAGRPICRKPRPRIQAEGRLG